MIQASAGEAVDLEMLSRALKKLIKVCFLSRFEIPNSDLNRQLTTEKLLH